MYLFSLFMIYLRAGKQIQEVVLLDRHSQLEDGILQLRPQNVPPCKKTPKVNEKIWLTGPKMTSLCAHTSKPPYVHL